MIVLIIGRIIRFGILELLIISLLAVNVFTFALYMCDKRKAVKGRRRIRENTLIFFTLFCGGIGAFLGMRLARHKTRKGKFKAAVIIGLIIAFVPITHIIHGLTLDRSIRYLEIDFYSENWPAALNGYRIAFISDFHIITEEEMQGVVDELNQRELDLLVLGGDFSMRDNLYRETLRHIARIMATDGIFGVEGNHDDYRRLFAMKTQLGITPLDNSGYHIRPGFYLAGVHDAWNRIPNIREAIAGAYADDFVLLVSHNPDVAMAQPTDGIDLILSGHTHGGQITFFGLPLYLLRGSITAHGMRFGRGFGYCAQGVPVFTSSGVGTYYNVPRIFARPEVVIFTIKQLACAQNV